LLDGIYVLANVSGCNITGNKIYDDRATRIMRNGIAIVAGSGDRFTIVSNEIIGFTNQPIADGSTGHAKVIVHNTGHDTVIPVVASAATIALPHNPLVSLTGATTVTTIGTQSHATGRQIVIIPTGVVTFTGGAGNIANTLTTVANVPVLAVFNGTNWYLK